MRIALFVVICIVIFFAIGEALQMIKNNGAKAVWAEVAMFFIVLLYILVAAALALGGSLWQVLTCR
jgi:hypothetical protein